MKVPLKQGLKLERRNHAGYDRQVTVKVPLKQGLKLFIGIVFIKPFFCYSESSIKTRIET